MADDYPSLSQARDQRGETSSMIMLDFIALKQLCKNRLGVHDVSCPLCGPTRHALHNRKRKVLRIWFRREGLITYACARCGERGYACDRQQDLNSSRNGLAVAAKEDAAHAQSQRDKAIWLWQQRKPIESTPAETYLREFRGIRVALPLTLGFLPPLNDNQRPALIGAFGMASECEPGRLTLADRHVRGVHLTLLRGDGMGKADVEVPKLFIGRGSSGWPIVVGPANDLLGLAVCEGIEDALSVHQATGLGAWAGGCANRMPALVERIPDHIEAVTIFAHSDAHGRRYANELAHLLAQRDVEVLVEGISS
jgi:hypothetical protein